jgi:hypothetical protein
MQIELSENERSNLMILLDVAIKAGGMQAAKAAMPIIDKLENPADPLEGGDDD